MHVRCGVIQFRWSFLVQHTKAVRYKNKQTLTNELSETEQESLVQLRASAGSELYSYKIIS